MSEAGHPVEQIEAGLLFLADLPANPQRQALYA
jgi:hypothetical protein